MTEIGGRGQSPAGQGTAGFARERALADGRPGDARGSTASLDAKIKPGNRSTASEATPDRLAAFQRSMHRATANESNETADARLLASAEWSGTNFTALMQQGAAPADKPAASATQTLVSAIAARIEQAVKAELIAAATAPTVVVIDLGDLAGGLQSLTVTMTATGLDVTFAHAMGTLPEEFIHATQSLAEKLSRRFTGRTVRILEAAASHADSGEEPGAGQGMQAISSLLGRAAQNR